MSLSVAQRTSADKFLQLLQEHNIASQINLDDALLNISQSLPESEYDLFLRQATALPISPPTLELILASKECGTMFETWLRKTFPKDPKKFAGSVCSLLLTRLASSLPFAYPFDRKVALDLGSDRALVEYAPRVMQHLIWFLQQSPPLLGNTADMDPESEDIQILEDIQITVQRSQRQRKGAKKGSSKAVPDPILAKACAAWQVEYPVADVDDANEALLEIHEEQLDILKHYLTTLRDPAVEAHLRQTHIPSQHVEESRPKVSDERAPAMEIVAPAEVPAAFPMVQPMKAALYFDSAEGFGDWRILISTRADRDLRDARRKDAKFFKIIIKKIKELSKGHFSDDNQKRLNGPNTEIPIFEAKMTRDSRLIYQIDCIPEYDDKFERQIIKIYGVYTHTQINKHLWDSIGYQLFLKKGKEYKQRCIFRSHPKADGDNVFSPACFPAVEHVSEDESNLPQLPHESLEEMHTLLVLEKFVPFSQALLNSIIADLDVAHVFNVSPQEKEIVEYPYSCYVLGRSGTGKTTTMLFKMLGIERAYILRKDSMQKPRQIFVTQSRVLAGKVEEYFSKLLDSLATAEKSKEELARLIKDKKQQQDDHEGLIDIDDDQNWRGDLPSRFSHLQDEHFPLFLTFDRLASMLEADMAELSLTDASAGLSSTSVKWLKSDSLITYNRFLQHYWPHLPQNLRKGLDPALVFSELMGVIQGSEESLRQESRFLDKKAYENLSHRAQYAFASRRETIYSIFLSYLKQKKTSAEYDAADRTHRLLKVFQTNGVPGHKIDYLYVDEAQDNLLIDALLLRSLVRNPDGLFWAGDTAQTISVGSSFRFNDLKAFLFRLEKRREQVAEDLDNDSVFKQEAPRTFHLAVNYRSHGGIVQCAHSVIELITEFWPYAIDVLARERGVVDGSKPVFFSGWDSETVRYEQFLFGESGNPIEFGAQQCILVRDESARDELRQQVGDIGLIMTLYESKGLEFDDVLLYKFFEDSTVELSQWRVVLNLLRDSQHDTSAPKFDEVRHAGVCSELKFLYVAITRARKNLWLVDCSEKSEPMRVFWTERNEIQNCTPGTDVPRLAVSSTPEEWEKSGRTLFSNKRYLQAMHCFERAGLDREATVTHTYYLREQARLTPISTSKQGTLLRQKAFVAAAEAFLKCSTSATNAKERKAYLKSSAECFEQAGEDFRAANAYSEAGDYNMAVKLYRKCGKFDEAVDIIKTNQQEVDAVIAGGLVDVARLYYFGRGELEKANKLFDSIEEELEYLEDYDLDVSRAAVLTKLGKFEAAADIHLAEGRTLDAIRASLMDKDNEDSIRRAYHYILKGLWEKASFGVRGLDRIKQVVQLLDLAATLQVLTHESFDIDELSMFQAIRSSNKAALLDLGRKFLTKSQTLPAILCLDHYFSAIPSLKSISSAEISKYLEDFLVYCQLIHRVIMTAKPCDDTRIQKLFAISPFSEGKFFLPTATYLNNKALESRAQVSDTNDQGIVVSEWQLSQLLKDHLARRIRQQIYVQNEECKHASAFNLCSLFIVNQQCSRHECPNQHIPSTSLTSDWYNLHVKIHFQQILIVQTWCHLIYSTVDRMRNTREWVGRLFDVLYPLWYRMGSINNLDTSKIVEAPHVSVVLKNWWSLEFLYASHREVDERLLSTIYQIMKLCLRLDKERTVEHVKRAPLMNTFRRLPNFQRKNGEDSVCVVDDLFGSLSTINGDSVTRGILAVKLILDKKLAIDANILLQTIESMCGAIVFVHRNFNLNYVSLPRSWLVNLIRVLVLSDLKFPMSIIPIKVFIDTMRAFMDKMRNPQQLAHLLVDRSNLFNLRGTRNIYIARLCRALCLLGYNINNVELHGEILKIVQSLNFEKYPHNLYKDYAAATQWGDLAKLVQKSITDCPLDEMIELVYQTRKVNYPARMRRITYSRIIDIPSLLNTTNSSAAAVASTLRPDAPAFVPRPQVTEASAMVDEPEQNTDEPEADNVQIISNVTEAEIITVEAQQDNSLPPTERQINAVKIIESAYQNRILLKQKTQQTQKTDTLSLSRSSCFGACLLESKQLDWPSASYYRRLFLGPLPHVLVCLKFAHAWAIDMKKRNRKRFKSASHQELEDINKRLTDQKKLIDSIQSLQKALSPSSELHRRRDIEELKKYVLDVETLLVELGTPLINEVGNDLAIGLKGIVAIRKTPKAKPKPKLRIDDDDANYADAYPSADEDSVDCQEDKSITSEATESVKDLADEPVVVATGNSPKEEFVREGVSDNVIQSLPWVPVKTEIQGVIDTTLDDQVRDESPESQSDDMVMQSLSWVPV